MTRAGKCIVLLYFSLISLQVFAQTKADNEVYLFSYFKGNGEDGLHLAYSLDGYNWESLNQNRSFLSPTAGKDKLMRDPCIIRGGDGRFHMVWTVSWNEKGIGYASSDDLIHWSEQKYIPVMEHEEDARNCWAPEAVYDSKTKTYLIFWATTITGRFPETQSTEDNGYNHRMYYVTTKDFKSFSETGLFYEPGFNVIDATIIKDKKKYVMLVKDETKEPVQKNIRVTSSKHLTKGYSTKVSSPITGDYWAEGPTATKVGDQWIAYFDKYTQKKMGAVASTDLQTWTDISDNVNFPKGTRHGTVFKIKKEEFENLKKHIATL
jgi:predicted GH43/DUF377 family glycosyl hydrolase